jgi:hypothetical protein
MSEREVDVTTIFIYNIAIKVKDLSSSNYHGTIITLVINSLDGLDDESSL